MKSSLLAARLLRSSALGVTLAVAAGSVPALAQDATDATACSGNHDGVGNGQLSSSSRSRISRTRRNAVVRDMPA